MPAAADATAEAEAETAAVTVVVAAVVVEGEADTELASDSADSASSRRQVHDYYEVRSLAQINCPNGFRLWSALLHPTGELTLMRRNPPM